MNLPSVVAYKHLTEQRIITIDDKGLPLIADGAGVLMTNANGLCKLSVTDKDTRAIVVGPDAVMTYLSPGIWYYDPPAEIFSIGGGLLIRIQLYDALGLTLLATYDLIAEDGM